MESAIQKCGNVKSLAEILRVSPRTVRDWRREKFLVPFGAAVVLRRKQGLILPKNVKLKDKYWYVSKGAYNGGLASYRKQGEQIGDPKVRLEKWREWWKKTGKFEKEPDSPPEILSKAE